MKKQVTLSIIVGGIMSLSIASCAQQKNDKSNEYIKEQKKRGCGCSSENILDLRASERPSDDIADPKAKL